MSTTKFEGKVNNQLFDNVEAYNKALISAMKSNERFSASSHTYSVEEDENCKCENCCGCNCENPTCTCKNEYCKELKSPTDFLKANAFPGLDILKSELYSYITNPDSISEKKQEIFKSWVDEIYRGINQKNENEFKKLLSADNPDSWDDSKLKEVATAIGYISNEIANVIDKYVAVDDEANDLIDEYCKEEIDLRNKIDNTYESIAEVKNKIAKLNSQIEQYERSIENNKSNIKTIQKNKKESKKDFDFYEYMINLCMNLQEFYDWLYDMVTEEMESRMNPTTKVEIKETKPQQETTYEVRKKEPMDLEKMMIEAIAKNANTSVEETKTILDAVGGLSAMCKMLGLDFETLKKGALKYCEDEENKKSFLRLFK